MRNVHHHPLQIQSKSLAKFSLTSYSPAQKSLMSTVVNATMESKAASRPSKPAEISTRPLILAKTVLRLAAVSAVISDSKVISLKKAKLMNDSVSSSSLNLMLTLASISSIDSTIKAIILN